MKPPKDALDQLLRALQDRQVPLGRDDVQWAFKSPSTASIVEEWVRKYLGPDTLLSQEELDLYQKLERTGATRGITASNDLSTISPLTDDDLRAAIESLQNSSAAIDEQTTVLKKQRDALEGITLQRHAAHSTRDETNRRRDQRYLQEKQRTATAVEELSQDLSSHLVEYQQQARSQTKLMNTGVAETLRSDDKTLSRLEDLMRETVSTSSEQTRAEAESTQASRLSDKSVSLAPTEVRRLTANLVFRLINLKTEEIRCRLDRVYLESYEKSSAEEVVHQGISKDETGTIEEELESLYSEIAPVSQMSVQQEYLQPLLQAIEDQKTRIVGQSVAALKYILKDRALELQAHHGAISAIASIAKAHGLFEPTEMISQSELTKPSTQGLSLSGSMSPVRKGTSHHKSSPASAEEDRKAVEQMFRHLGLHWDAGILEEQGIDPVLSALIAEQEAKLRTQLASLDSSTDTELADHIGGLERSIRLLLENFYVNSQYGDVHVLDQDLENRLHALERKVSHVGEWMERLDVEALGRGDKGREDFLERWSG
ncbi:MAG: hypothetical protein M1833_002140 [Piccolia ochrophora]|nr:MAG: hypothetical protein M1833_002140 [Piccolia ochrophora]